MTDHDSLNDRPTAVRPGEELDRARLAALLAGLVPGAGAPAIAQFPGGMSNLTYLISAGGRELVLRRPPFGAQVRGGHDMAREHRILAALSAAGYAVPQPVALVEDESVLGAPFYLMERVRGVILRSPPPPGLDLGPGPMRRVCLALVDAMAELHALDYAAAGLADLGRPEGYTARQVAGWARRYEAARADGAPDLAPVAAWLAANLPPEAPGALIHNDFRYDNVVLDPADLTRIVAILDWELATVGDPLTDLGTTLAYWAEPGDPAPLRAFGLTDRPGNLDRQGVIERYAERSRRDVSAMLFYYVYGLFKNGVIILQIYARYRQGHTRDPRFAGLLAPLGAIADLAGRAIERGRVSRLYAA
jgi:aminoglycoside phosphotransferase (APT) family kinase protein